MPNPGEEVTWANFGFRILINTATHPLEYAKVLMQIGHEPVAPYPTTTLFGKPAYVLPNVFKYVAYIKSVDGFMGCYRGLGPKICANIVSTVTFQKASEAIVPPSVDVKPDEELTEDEKNYLFVRNLMRDIGARAAAVFASQPFNVIALRTMAQFVGGETKYTGILGSVVEIYRENGLPGFFSGLTPRVIGEIATLLLTAVFTYGVNRYVVEDTEMQPYTNMFIGYIASSLTYPFQVVSNTMAVNNCQLLAGLPPQMPIYTSWTDCWSHLSQTNQLKRGNSIIFRYYSVAKVIDEPSVDKKHFFQFSK